MGNPVFAIENQQNRLVTFADMENRVLKKKFKMAAKNKSFETGQVRCRFILIQTRWSLIWSYFVDLMSRFCEIGKKMKMSYLTEYIYIVLSDLVF